jgi:hypothetical protein
MFEKNWEPCDETQIHIKFSWESPPCPLIWTSSQVSDFFQTQSYANKYKSHKRRSFHSIFIKLI